MGDLPKLYCSCIWQILQARNTPRNSFKYYVLCALLNLKRNISFIEPIPWQSEKKICEKIHLFPATPFFVYVCILNFSLLKEGNWKIRKSVFKERLCSNYCWHSVQCSVTRGKRTYGKQILDHKLIVEKKAEQIKIYGSLKTNNNVNKLSWVILY